MIGSRTQERQPAMPKVSIIVPVFNGAPYLAECLDSILAQTADDFEVVCIDDGSTDGTPEILASYAVRDPRLGWFSQGGGGLSASCNRGIDLSSGQYLLFCDASDRLRPDAIRSLVERIERDDLDALFLEGDSLFDNETAGRPPNGDGAASAPACRPRLPSVLFRSTRKDLKEANDRLDRLTRSKEAAIVARDQAIAARDRNIAGKTEMIACRNAEIARLTDICKARKSAIDEKDALIQARDAKLAATKEQLARVKARLAEISRARQRLADRNRQLAGRNRWLKDRNRQLERSFTLRLVGMPGRLLGLLKQRFR